MAKGLRLTLDDGVSYDLAAMFTPRRVGVAAAWAALRANLSAWPKGLRIPFTARRVTSKGTFAWLLVMLTFTLSLALLPFLAICGWSTRACALHTTEDATRLRTYQWQVKGAMERLRDIDDPEEYRRRLTAEIARIKPPRD